MKQTIARLILLMLFSVPVFVVGFINGTAVVNLLELPLNNFKILITTIIGIIVLAAELFVIFGLLFLFAWAQENA